MSASCTPDGRLSTAPYGPLLGRPFHAGRVLHIRSWTESRRWGGRTGAFQIHPDLFQIVALHATTFASLKSYYSSSTVCGSQEYIWCTPSMKTWLKTPQAILLVVSVGPRILFRPAAKNWWDPVARSMHTPGVCLSNKHRASPKEVRKCCPWIRHWHVKLSSASSPSIKRSLCRRSGSDEPLRVDVKVRQTLFLNPQGRDEWK